MGYVSLSEKIKTEAELTAMYKACLQIGKESNGNERLTIPEARKEPWNNLELPTGHKELVQSLITSHFSTDISKELQFDLVRDKGKYLS